MREFFAKLRFKRQMKKFKKYYGLSAKGECIKNYCARIMSGEYMETIEAYEEPIMNIAKNIDGTRFEAASIIFYCLDYLGD